MPVQATRPLVLGRISGVFGVKGWVRVFDFSRERGSILEHPRWLLRRGADWQEAVLIAGQRHGKGVVAQLEGCEDRDQALALIGVDIAVWPQWLAAPEKDEYYWYQLEGMEVVNLAGEPLGRVDHLIETGANDVLVLSGERERLIPYLPETVREVDLDTGRMVVDWDKDF